jgi:hypothetical protein
MEYKDRIEQFGKPYRHDAWSSDDEKQVYSVVNHNE